MSKALLLALQITCMFLSPAQALPASHRLLKRAVSWIAPSDPRAASSICSPQQQQQIAQWQSESMAIAAKGRDALDLLSEALSSEGSTDNWWALDDYDRLRLQVSFQAVLAGKITPDVQQDRLSRATTIRGKSLLSRTRHFCVLVIEGSDSPGRYIQQHCESWIPRCLAHKSPHRM